jgi:hypothetical protein
VLKERSQGKTRRENRKNYRVGKREKQRKRERQRRRRKGEG